MGAILIGIGATRTWVTVGLSGVQTNTNTAIKGIDMVEGKISLACALVMLIGVLGARMVADRRLRIGLASLMNGTAVLAAIVAMNFLQDGLDRQVVLDAVGIPRAQWVAIGVFREFGPGVYWVRAGGLIGFAGAVLTLVWAVRSARAPAAEA